MNSSSICAAEVLNFGRCIHFLHTDGYKAYRSIDDVIIVGCWVHVRRRFCEAFEVLPENQRKGSTAENALEYCGKLYAIEKKLKP